MKRLFLVLICLLGLSGCVTSGTSVVSSIVIKPSSIGVPIHYTVYYTDGVENFNLTIPSSQTKIPVTDLKLVTGVTYTVTIKASNLSGESLGSNTLSVTAR
jgi:hypothetical protein